MSDKRVRMTSDYLRFGVNVSVFCPNCRRSRLVGGKAFYGWFMPPVRIEEAALRLRCRSCGTRGAVLRPVVA
jgi:hypothetical protein